MVREVDQWRGQLLQALVAGIRSDTNDRDPILCRLAEAEALADRILTRKISPRERRIDDRDRGRWLAIVRGERTSLDERDAQRTGNNPGTRTSAANGRSAWLPA